MQQTMQGGATKTHLGTTKPLHSLENWLSLNEDRILPHVTHRQVNLQTGQQNIDDN